ncbi:MAG: chemotaxis protein CheC [Planctomycetota bacterium]
MSDNVLSPVQVAALDRVLHDGAAKAATALGQWLGRPVTIDVDAVEQLPLADAADVLGAGDAPICFCEASLAGHLTGQLILAFDDASGLALADLLQSQPRGTATEWGEMEQSAALETANIVGCAYLNVAADALPGTDDGILPSPPRFSRDYAESLIEFALMDQIGASANVLLARSRFRIDVESVDWTLLLVPDAASVARLSGELS